jgi:hypothetical protein
MLLRALVLLLLAMNVGAAAWWALRPPPAAPPLMPATDPEVPPLVLLSELEPGSAALVAEASEAPEPISPEPARECLEIGPFLTQADLRRAVGALTPGARRIQFREATAVVQRGYRVFLPAPPSREAALAAARGLFGRGIRDYYVVTSGEDENTISFGLYRNEANALRRQQEVLGFGVEARVEPRSESIPQFWVDLDSNEGFDWRAALGGYSGVASRSIPCD